MYSLACLFLTLWSLKGAKAIENPTPQLYEHRGRNIKHDGSGTNFITLLGDTSNPKGTWPWVCSLGTHGLKDKSEWVHICTGVIASENHIITTVGCLEQFKWTVDNYDVVVRAGDRNIKVPYDDADVQTKYIASHEIHPDYKGPYNEADYEPYHDIAILTTNSSFNFTKYVRPIDLPEIRNGEVLRQNEIEEFLIFSDWAGPHRTLKPLLNTKFLLIEPPGVCQTLYPSLNVTHELMCGVDHLSLSRNCQLDFGSPVIKEDSEINRYVLKGLLTMDIDEHEGCENSTNPNLIVSVASTRNLQFIYETMFNNPLSSMRQDEVIVIPVTIPEENNLSYENCGRNSILDDKPTLDNSQLAKYPWQVSLGLMAEPTDIKEWIHFCGGSILSPTKIITAAHCNLKLEKIPGTIQVRAGDDNLQKTRDNRGVQLSEIKEYSSHPKYNRTTGTRYFDVGIITLKEPLNMTKYVRPICLPSLSEVKMLTKESEEGTPLTVTGWGSNDYGQVGEDLKAAIAVVLNEEKCNETHQLEYFNKNFVPDLFTSDLLCAEDPIGDAGTCDGDSGGPAVYFHHEKRKYFLRAIVSGSARRICGTKLFPNVYVRIADPFILEWILNQGLNTTTTENVTSTPQVSIITTTVKTITNNSTSTTTTTMTTTTLTKTTSATVKASRVLTKGLRRFKATMGSGSEDGTDDDVSVELSRGVNGQTCKTGVLWEGGLYNSWSSGDVEEYKASNQDFGDCGNFENDGSPIGFTIIKTGNDGLKLVKMEFDIGGEIYVWRGAAWWDPTHPVLTTTWHQGESVLIESTGGAAEWQGRRMGYFDRIDRLENQRPVYSQRDGHVYLYHSTGSWRVGSTVGSYGASLKVPSTNLIPPTEDWQYYGGGKWHTDSTLLLTISPPDPSSTCTSIQVSSTGPAGTAQSSKMGSYRWEGEWLNGRKVFVGGSGNNRYLRIPTGSTAWGISHTKDSGTSGIQSGRGTTCPCRGAGPSSRLGRDGWRYSDYGWHEDESLQVTCV